jgi:hypothetical protein
MRRHVGVVFNGVEISPRQLIATIRIAIVRLVEMPAKNEV